MTFTTWDYVVFVLTVVISVAIGIYTRFSGGRQKTVEEYLMADRSMTIWPVAFSLMASFTSSIALLGATNEIYSYGTQFIVKSISYVFGNPIITNFYLPVFYNMKVTSAYEYLEKRFGLPARLVASISFSIQMILYMGVVLYAPSLALEAATGISRTYSILIMGFVCAFYSVIGGMKAILFTDVFQTMLMFAAILTVCISGLVWGGYGEIFAVADKGGRLELWNFNIDPTVRHTWFTLFLGGIGQHLSLYGINQSQVQRMLSVKTLKDAQKSIWWAWSILMGMHLLTGFCGLVLYWYYHDCDPFLAGRITSRDQNMAIYMLDALGHLPGLAGLFIAGIFAASLSTVSVALNSLAAITLEDYYKNIYKLIKKKPLEVSSNSSAFTAKIVAAIYGVLCIGVAFLAQNMNGVLQTSLTIFGVIGGPLLGLFTLGMFTQIANQWGVIIGHLAGLAISLWSQLGQPRPSPKLLPFSIEDCSQFGVFNVSKAMNPLLDGHETSIFDKSNAQDSSYFYLYRISYMYANLIGFLMTFILGYTMSYIFYWLKYQNMDKTYIDVKTKEINSDLFSPPIARIFKKKTFVANKNIF